MTPGRAWVPGSCTSTVMSSSNPCIDRQRDQAVLGRRTGNRLTSLLHDHITIAVQIPQAAKAGNTKAFNAANTSWYANGNDIADFLAAANPSLLARRRHARRHEDATSTRPWLRPPTSSTVSTPPSVTDYEGIHAHILMMADQLSAGIIAQVPSRFR